MKVAIVHDWLVTYAGAERVLEQIIELYPDADLFSVVDFLEPDNRAFIKNKSVNTSFIQKLPFARKKYRSYLPIMPFAIEQFDLSKYQLVISCSHAVAKGVITGPDQLHICYCFSPMRYAWDLQHQYLKEADIDTGFKSWLARFLLFKMRGWDYRTANGVDYFVADSDYIARRIKKIYRRDAVTIYPNVAVDSFDCTQEKKDYYLAASRMVPYKKMDLIVKAFSNMPDKKLVVIGDGPQFNKVKAASAKNITLLGYQSSEVLKRHLESAKGFVFAAEEDFGILPLEAQACGTPVIAYAKGGTLETVIPNKTGVFFKEQTEESIIQAIHRFEAGLVFDATKIRLHAEKFSETVFKDKFSTFVDGCKRDFFD